MNLCGELIWGTFMNLCEEELMNCFLHQVVRSKSSLIGLSSMFQAISWCHLLKLFSLPIFPSLSLHPLLLSLSFLSLSLPPPDVHQSGSAFNYAYEQMRNSVIAQSGAVCGSNAKDYKNLCELAKASCASQTRITIKYFGLCGMWAVVYKLTWEWWESRRDPERSRENLDPADN